MIHNIFIVYLGNYFRQVIAIGSYLHSLAQSQLMPSQSGPKQSDQAGQSIRGGEGQAVVIIIVAPNLQETKTRLEYVLRLLAGVLIQLWCKDR